MVEGLPVPPVYPLDETTWLIHMSMISSPKQDPEPPGPQQRPKLPNWNPRPQRQDARTPGPDPAMGMEAKSSGGVACGKEEG